MKITISTIQADLFWEDKSSNLKMFETAFEEVSNDSKLVILPEMFSTGFSMNPCHLAEMYNEKTVNWMQTKAKEINKWICGSLIIHENDTYYNRLFVCSPNGKYHTYNKKHLFRYANEHLNYSDGSNELILDIEGVKFSFFICYDLRFPVWSRNLNLKYDAAVYVANWPKKRREHWSSLLKARAIENQAYVIGVNRIGTDGNGVEHSGDTAVFDALGKQISKTQPHEFCVENVELNIDLLREYRAKFPAHLDADDFKLL